MKRHCSNTFRCLAFGNLFKTNLSAMCVAQKVPEMPNVFFRIDTQASRAISYVKCSSHKVRTQLTTQANWSVLDKTWKKTD